jgi:DnaJ domain
MADCCEFLQGELNRLGATRVVLSTNTPRKINGEPYANQKQPADTGAAVYFEFKRKPVSLACDKWDRVEDNVQAIAKHIEALRGQERWGVGTMEQAFRGYQALPAVGESEASIWWQVLGVPVNATEEQVRQAYRILVKKFHPDTGGTDPERFHRVQRAMERFEAEINHRNQPA